MSASIDYGTGLDPSSETITMPTVVWKDDEFVAVLKFLCIPAVFGFCALVLGIVPRAGLYIFAAVYGVALLYKSTKNPEYMMACFIMYMPVSSMMPVSLLPGVNATNIFLMVLIALAFFDRHSDQNVPSSNEDNDLSPWERAADKSVGMGTKATLLKFYFVYTSLSAITAVLENGVGHIVSDHLLTFKGWIDQALLVFVFAALIKDSPRAIRVVIYMMMANAVLIMLGLQEAIEKIGLSSIEKSRVVGPVGNPNDFGAFLVYSTAPYIGMALMLVPRIKSLPFLLYLVVMLRVLLATFSRGAYLALGAGVFAASWIKGMRFTLAAGVFVLCGLLIFPSLMPDAIIDRMGMRDDGHTELAEPELDKSSAMRFVMWNAAIDMTKESPVYGKGFKMFEALIDVYAEEEVDIADPHNMYLYISSQMGLPAVVAFAFLWIVLFFRSKALFTKQQQEIIRAIGIGGGLVAASVVVFNMFGSRMVSIETAGFAWIYILVVNRLTQDMHGFELKNRPAQGGFL